jgi:starch-binding outer membrane protein, SusD/RagB family
MIRKNINMNKMIKILPVMLLFISCSKDFLERENPEMVTLDSFYKTEADFNLALSGVYNVLVRSDYYNGYLFRYLEIASDDANPGDDPEYNSLIGNHINEFTLTPDNYTSINIFSASYIGIARANTTIERLKGSGLSEGFIIQTESECRFLRALYYFNLVRLFGDVPLILKEVTGPEDVQVPRAAVMEVYEKCIVPDLQFAVQNLPDTYTNQDVARASRWAAKGLLANVYLTLGEKDQTNYHKSRDLTWQIINNTRFSLEENFADLFARENEFGRESLFEINHVSGQYFYKPEGYGVGHYIPQRNGVGSYYNIFYMPRFRGIGYLGPKEGAFSQGGYGIGVPTTSNDPRGANYSVPQGTGIVEAFHTGDTRRVTTILDYYKTAGEMGLPVDYDISPYNVNKYNDFEDNENGEADDNYFILRLADIYLMFAEAENEINNGPTNDAYEYLNRVRRRAFGEPVTGASVHDYADLDYSRFLDKVYHERRLELAYEGQRWFDLLRRPEKALSVLRAQGKTHVTAGRLFLPIPQYVIDETNGLIIQNPGY